MSSDILPELDDKNEYILDLIFYFSETLISLIFIALVQTIAQWWHGQIYNKISIYQKIDSLNAIFWERKKRTPSLQKLFFKQLSGKIIACMIWFNELPKPGRASFRVAYTTMPGIIIASRKSIYCSQLRFECCPYSFGNFLCSNKRWKRAKFSYKWNGKSSSGAQFFTTFLVNVFLDIIIEKEQKHFFFIKYNNQVVNFF